MNSLLTEANLEAGITYWRNTKTKWEPDFHNAYYEKFNNRQCTGLNEEWWEWMVHELRLWQASRPKTDAYFRERGRERLNKLQSARDRIFCAIEPQRPGLENTNWTLLSELYFCAKSIKNVDSPVFASKLCHFIIPNAFPIIDGEAIGFQNNDYARYWDFCQRQWLHCQAKEKLQSRLRMLIGQQAVDCYPWSTKLTELCIIRKPKFCLVAFCTIQGHSNKRHRRSTDMVEHSMCNPAAVRSNRIGGITFQEVSSLSHVRLVAISL